MTISLKPVEATYVDLSAVEDVERERLRITFESGKQLSLKVDLRYGARAPRLIVDFANDPDGVAENLRHHLSEQFYCNRVYRKFTKRVIDAVALFFDGHYYIPLRGWTYAGVREKLEIVVDGGGKRRSSSLAVGNYLHVKYAVPDANLQDEGLGNLGTIKSIESFMLEPTSLVPALVKA